MVIAHDPDAVGGLMAAFERLSALVEVPTLAPDQQTAFREFDQELRHHLRTQELVITRYEFLFEVAPDPYVVTDTEGTITEINAAAREFLGVDTSTVNRRDLADFVTEDERPRYFGWLEQLRAGAPEARWDTELVLAGHTRPVPVEINLADDLEGTHHTCYNWYGGRLSIQNKVRI